MRAYKFLTAEGRGVFSRFPWPLPAERPGGWVESEVDPCRSGIHACRASDLPYWTAAALYEIELEGRVEEHALKLVAARGRLVRRVDLWNAGAQAAYGRMCVDRARELAAAAPLELADWAPPADIPLEQSARLGFIAARIAEELGGPMAYQAERARQSAWLVGRLALD